MPEVVNLTHNKKQQLKDITARVLAEFYNDGENLTQETIAKASKVALDIYKQRQRNAKAAVVAKPMRKALQIVPPITPKQSKILNIAVDIQESSAKDVNSLAFMAKHFVQTTLPHREPKNGNEWIRKNGKLALILRAGGGINSTTGEYESYGFPYGTIPRLLLIWMSTTVIRTKSRYLELGHSLSEFMLKLGLDPNPRDKNSPAHRLKNQLYRLVHCIISINQNIEIDNETYQRFMYMPLVQSGLLKWCPRNGNIPKGIKEELQGSWLYLSEPFYDCLTSSCVPLDARIIKEIKQSPLALDLYAWMVHRTYSVNHAGKNSFVTRQQLHDQFGSSYADMKDFKKRVKPHLRIIKSMSHHLCLTEGKGGLHIGKKFTVVQSTPE